MLFGAILSSTDLQESDEALAAARGCSGRCVVETLHTQRGCYQTTHGSLSIEIQIKIKKKWRRGEMDRQSKGRRRRKDGEGGMERRKYLEKK